MPQEIFAMLSILEKLNSFLASWNLHLKTGINIYIYIIQIKSKMISHSRKKKMNSSKIYSLALSGFVKHPSSGEQIFKYLNIYIYILLIVSKYVPWVNEWRFNIYRECWTLIIAFQTKNTPKNTFILFIFHVFKFWRGENT